MEALIPFMPWIWVAVVIITIVWELTTFDLNCLWFTISATVSLILSFFPDVFSPVIQILIFAVLSMVLFFALKRWAQKAMTVPDTPTNVDAFIGKEVTLIDNIAPGKIGTAKVNGVIWSVELEDKNDTAASGEVLVVVRVEGNKLIAKKDQ